MAPHHAGPPGAGCASCASCSGTGTSSGDRVERLHPPARPGVVAGRVRGNGPRPGASAGGLRPRWRGDRAAGRRRVFLPVFVRSPLRRLRRRPSGSRLYAGGARVIGRRQRGGRTRASARRPRLPQSRAARRPGGGRYGAGVRRAGAHGSETRIPIRGRRDLGRLGGAVARGCARDVRGLGPHPRLVSEVCGPVRACTRCRPGLISALASEEREVALAALLDEARAVRARISGTPRSGFPRRERGAARTVSRGRASTVVYFGKLIEQKGVHVLLDALQGLDARVVVVGFGRSAHR